MTALRIVDEPPVLPPGLHRGIPMRDYLALNAMGSGRLEWLNTSPLHYRYMLEQPRESTDAQDLGTALHMAVLEPALFEEAYVLEPLDVAPLNAKPRATNAYREAVAALQEGGRTVLREDVMEKVRAMADAVRGHEHAAALLARAPERELTMVWEYGGRLCRGRADMLGDRVVGDLKTTRSLKDFSPWVISKFGYHRQAAFYELGLRALDRKIEHYFLVAVENVEPFDVGVFALENAARIAGFMHNEYLLQRLNECETSGRWPGMYPTVVPGTITDALMESLGEEVAS